MNSTQEPKKAQTGDQKSLSQLKNEIETSKDKLFLINHSATG